MDGSSALVGALGSKNMVGLYSILGIYFSLIILYRVRQGGLPALLAVMTMALCALGLVKAHSAGSVLSLGGAIAVTFGVMFIARFPQRVRGRLLGAVATVVVIVGIVAVNLGVQGDVLSAFGKNATLTGRTYLWGQGIKAGLENPILGDGYAAFWVVGEPKAERYWHEFKIDNKYGFHFHNMYVQTFVDLGGVGVIILAYLVLSSFIRSIRRAARDGADAESLLCLGISTFFLVRSFVEVDFIGPFGVPAFLFFSVLPRLEEYRGTTATPSQPLPRQRDIKPGPYPRPAQ